MLEKGGFIVSEAGLATLQGHTEISTIFNDFAKSRPEAKEFVTSFPHPSWNKHEWDLKARRFKFVPNEMIDFLLNIWEIKLDMILAEQPTQ